MLLSTALALALATAPVEATSAAQLPRWAFVTSAAVTLASGAALLGTVLWSKDLSAQANRAVFASQAVALDRQAQTAGMASTVLLGVVVSLAITTCIIAVFTRWSGPNPEPAPVQL